MDYRPLAVNHFKDIQMAQIHIVGGESPSELRIIARCLMDLADDREGECGGNCSMESLAARQRQLNATQSKMLAAGLALAAGGAAAYVVPEAPEAPQPPAGALSTAGAGQSPTAPAEMPAATPTPATASVPAPSVATPPPPAVPAAPPTASLAGSVEVDARGLPWDSRIHSSGKTLLASGNWRNKGGVPPERVAAVEAELQAAMSVPAAPATSPSPAADPLPAQAFGGVPVPPPPPAAPAPTFATLMQRITGAVTTGKLTQAAVGEAIRAVGLPSLPGLAARPDLVPEVWAYLDALLVA